MPQFDIDRDALMRAQQHLDENAGEAEPRLDAAIAKAQEHEGTEREQEAKDQVEDLMRGLGHVSVDLGAVHDNAMQVAKVCMVEDRDRIMGALSQPQMGARLEQAIDVVMDNIAEAFVMGIQIGVEASWQARQEGNDG